MLQILGEGSFQSMDQRWISHHSYTRPTWPIELYLSHREVRKVSAVSLLFNGHLPTREKSIWQSCCGFHSVPPRRRLATATSATL